jgi:radical SAM protein with 4Fe4S-binding SPASM domain
MMNHLVRAIPKLVTASIICYFKPEWVARRPIHLQVEPTTYCNLDCPQCPRQSYIDAPRHMTFNRFKDIIDHVRPTHLTLSGQGEPTLNTELPRMISYARKRSVNVNTTSNFVAVTKRQMEEMISSGLNLLNVSLDAATKETYMVVRSKDAFERTVHHLTSFLQIRREMKKENPKVRLAFVIQKANVEEIDSFYLLGKQIGIDAVLFQVFSDSAIRNKRELIMGMDAEKIYSGLERVAQQEKGYGLPASNASYLMQRMDYLSRIYGSKPINMARHCLKPWISAYITVEGDLRPCCSFGAKRMSMGNIFHSTVLTVYNSTPYRKFRNQLKGGRIPDPICARCIAETPLEILKRSRWTPGFIRS